MAEAYSLVTCRVGQGANAFKEIREISGIVEAHAVYGVYDMFVKVKGNTIDDCKEIIMEIRNLKEVHSTLTLFVIKGQ